MASQFKHVVVVHGIGDQKPNETVINFINEFVRAMPPLVRATVEVHNLLSETGLRGSQPAYISLTAADGKRHVIVFSEVYWQNVTNARLKENKNEPPIPIFSWAHSINTRLFAEKKRGGGDFRKAREAIDNLERMLNLLKALAVVYKKSGHLAEILKKFLGDVQMYAESSKIREEINNKFFPIVANGARIFQGGQVPPREREQQWDPPEIYIVSHSEGTVVSYYSLVEAARQRLDDPSKHAWLDRVCGLVTLGSPIDKHYTIWRNRFRTRFLEGKSPLEKKIPWRNYWDRSDPVGYGLRVLLKDSADPNKDDPTSDANLLFHRQYDKGFARYMIPGLAHEGYWTDRDILLDILQRTMGIGTPEGRADNRWWGNRFVMRSGDLLSYALARLATLAAMAYLLARLLHPLRAKLSWIIEGLCSPVAALKIWGDLEAQGDTTPRPIQAGIRAALLAAWLLAVSVTLPMLQPVTCDTCGTDIKDAVGYAGGLLVTMLIWKLHTTVHKGLLEMWRYAADWGADLVSDPEPTADRGPGGVG